MSRADSFFSEVEVKERTMQTAINAPTVFVRSPGAKLPLTARFRLGSEITSEQRAFLDEHGFLVFETVAKPNEVRTILSEIDRIEEQWIREGRESINGIPLFSGRSRDGRPMIQRFPFTSLFSDEIKRFVRDDRLKPVRSLIGSNTRVGDEEKDGVVFNRYLNMPGSARPNLGWHTDGLRDLFYLRMPKQMLNVGLHFDRCTKESGGLRILPGTHNQGFLSMCFKKPYFVSNKPDPNEVAVETEPGDLTVHDGRTWHRVEQSPFIGEKSLRRSMYVPYLTDEYQPKNEKSKTPIYLRLGRAMTSLRARFGGRV
jgi:ectoine hydroxylase-related dioxygenase (phytanoyl-CoA dioxygenase family)